MAPRQDWSPRRRIPSGEAYRISVMGADGRTLWLSDFYEGEYEWTPDLKWALEFYHSDAVGSVADAIRDHIRESGESWSLAVRWGPSFRSGS